MGLKVDQLNKNEIYARDQSIRNVDWSICLSRFISFCVGYLKAE